MNADALDSLAAVLAEQLPDDARMDAYYYGFDRTGVGIIDAILSALAYAGKGYHHTECWSDDYDYDYGPIQKGESSADAIQRIANEAAAALTQAAQAVAADKAEAVRAGRAEALRDAAARLGRTENADVEVALSGLGWVIDWLNARAEAEQGGGK